MHARALARCEAQKRVHMRARVWACVGPVPLARDVGGGDQCELDSRTDCRLNGVFESCSMHVRLRAGASQHGSLSILVWACPVGVLTSEQARVLYCHRERKRANESRDKSRMRRTRGAGLRGGEREILRRGDGENRDGEKERRRG